MNRKRQARRARLEGELFYAGRRILFQVAPEALERAAPSSVRGPLGAARLEQLARLEVVRGRCRPDGTVLIEPEDVPPGW